MVPHTIEHKIVSQPAVDEILPGVINHMVCADGSHHVHTPCAAYTGHVGAEGLGDLHGKRTHAPRRAVDQDLLPWLNPSFIAKALQGGACRHRHGGRLLEREVGGLQRQFLLVSTHILGEGAADAHAEYLVAWLKLRYVPADRFDLAGHIASRSCHLWFA